MGYFKVIVDLHSFLRHNTENSCGALIQFSPMGTSHPELLYLRVFVLFLRLSLTQEEVLTSPLRGQRRQKTEGNKSKKSKRGFLRYEG
jgi:hypothetical protein